MTLSRSLPALCCAGWLLAAGTAVSAQPAADAPQRTDPGRACPAIHQQLPDALARAYQHLNLDGVVQVQMRVRGNEVVAVQTLSGPPRYHRWVRSALREVACRVEGGEQTFAFAIRFADPAQLGPQRLAQLQALADKAP